MGTLTQAECNKINNSYKMPYATQELFESTHGLAHAVDLGGLVVYFNDKDLVAFYDYENEWGAYGFENEWREDTECEVEDLV
jgi:hypothetical protein